MRISDWSSDVCSSDLTGEFRIPLKGFGSTDCRRCRSHLLHLRAGGAAGKRAGLFGLTSFGSSVPGAECCPGRDRPRAMAWGDRKRVVSGKSVSVRVELGGRRIIKKKKTLTITT